MSHQIITFWRFYVYVLFHTFDCACDSKASLISLMICEMTQVQISRDLTQIVTLRNCFWLLSKIMILTTLTIASFIKSKSQKENRISTIKKYSPAFQVFGIDSVMCASLNLEKSRRKKKGPRLIISPFKWIVWRHTSFRLTKARDHILSLISWLNERAQFWVIRRKFNKLG